MVAKLLDFFKKNIIIFLIVAILIVILLLFLIDEPTPDVKFELYGSSQINIYLGEQYFEYGYYLSDNTYEVQVISEVDTSKLGSYKIRYRLTKNGEFKLEKFRMVNVIEDVLKNVTLTLNGRNPEYVLLNDSYKENGVTAVYNGVDISSSVITTNNVNTNAIGNYEVKYTVKVGGREKSISRFVQVFGIIFESEVDYQNKLIDINVVTHDFDHVVLPNEKEENSESFTYNYDKSGPYYFTVYTRSGYSKKYRVVVLDKVKPTGSCTAKINGDVTEVVITANDESGIKSYTYNNQTFSNNSFTINEKLSTFTVRIYDNSDNYLDVECKTRKTFDNNVDKITVPTKLTPCNGDVSKYNAELTNLVQEYGPKTRDAVAAVAEYLVKYFPYKVAYFWGGKRKTFGIDSSWGCWKSAFQKSDGSYTCTSLSGSKCIYGMDCAGYTAWAYITAGFDPSIIRTSDQSTGMWGNFNAKKHTYTFSKDKDKVELIKPGDIVHRPGHVGIVLGVSDTTIKIAHLIDGVKIDYMKKNGSNFKDFVLMDDFFEMYGNKY